MDILPNLKTAKRFLGTNAYSTGMVTATENLKPVLES